jgi:hypothetical protein
MTVRSLSTRALIALLTLSLAGGELELAAQTAARPNDPAQSTPQNRVVIPAPTTGPWEKKAGTQPANTTNDLPDAPSSAPKPPTTTYLDANQQPQDLDQQQPTSEAPLGTATAEKGVTVGGAASRPAGTAIAPTKQRQSRSLAIKVGAILAGGAALGTIYGLSRKTSPTPPGSGR